MTMNACITPNRKVDTNGYVPMPFQGRYQSMHRVTWQILNGPIATGIVIDHTCHNEDADCKGGNTCEHRKCVNPSHLRAVSHLENVQAGKRLLENNSHCVNGHLVADNLERRPSGRAFCRSCRTDANLVSGIRRKERG